MSLVATKSGAKEVATLIGHEEVNCLEEHSGVLPILRLFQRFTLRVAALGVKASHCTNPVSSGHKPLVLISVS